MDILIAVGNFRMYCIGIIEYANCLAMNQLMYNKLNILDLGIATYITVRTVYNSSISEDKAPQFNTAYIHSTQ